jgi:hypothetical protein
MTGEAVALLGQFWAGRGMGGGQHGGGDQGGGKRFHANVLDWVEVLGISNRAV